jgi:hypothetical protein
MRSAIQSNLYSALCESVPCNTQYRPVDMIQLLRDFVTTNNQSKEILSEFIVEIYRAKAQKSKFLIKDGCKISFQKIAQ